MRSVRQGVVVAACIVTVALTRSHVDVAQHRTATLLGQLAAARPFRVVKPRLSLLQTHSAFRPVSAVEFHDFARTHPDVARELAKLMNAPDTHPGRLHAAGMTSLLLGRWDEALQTLRSAAASRSDAHVDVAAAYYMRGLATRSLDDFSRSLEHLARAKASPQVTFNRALVLEQFRDREAAAAEWRAYLDADGRSPWADEAREHLRRVTAPTTSRKWESVKPAILAAARAGQAGDVAGAIDPFRLSARKLVEESILPSWGEAALRRDPGAANELAAARTLARALAQRTGDSMLADAVAEIDRGAATSALARGWADYGRGRRAIDAVDSARATELLSNARRSFEQAGSPAAGLAALSLGAARYYAYDYNGAERIVDATAAKFEPQRNRYLALFAHLAWYRGMLVTVGGDPSEGLRSFQRALAGFERLGERELQASQHTNLADTYSYLGDAERAAAHRYEALVITEELDDARRLHAILSEAADAALAASMPSAALAFQNRLVRLARRSGEPLQIADALITRSTILRRAGQRTNALRDLDEAKRAAFHVDDIPTRERVYADVGTAEAFAWREADDRRAIQALTPAIDFFRRVQYRMNVAQLLLERGRARLRLGEVEAAEQDFRDGIDALEQQRRRVDRSELRITYYDRAEGLFTDLAVSLLRRGRTVEAYDVVERSRARELLDVSRGAPMDSLPARELQRHLGSGIAIVTYALAKRSIVIGVLSRDELRVVENTVDIDALEGAVDAIQRGFDAPGGLPRAELRLLERQLIGPIRPLLRGQRVVFVPDGLLHRVPFAALFDGERHLVEEHITAVSPSATLYVRNAARDCALATRSAGAALLVASPDAPEGFGELAALDHTTVETSRIARLYRKHRLVRATDETAATMLGEATQHGLLHFGGHAIVDARNPEASMLLVGRRGRIRAADIERARLTRTRLVVLGACSTSLGKARRGEGALSIARAFLATSVPAVVSTIAPVEDGAAARLLTAFHTRYARSADPAAALRDAQLQLLRGKDSAFRNPARWSAFQVTGGSCTPTDRREDDV